MVRAAMKRSRLFTLLAAAAMLCAPGADAETGAAETNNTETGDPETGNIETGAERARPNRACEQTRHDGADYVVCRFDASSSDIRLFLYDEAGAPFGHFDRVNDALSARGARLAFAMNGGMYHEDRSPVGLYMQEGREIAPANTNDGPGNFHLKPNGVFWLSQENGRRRAGVSSAQEYMDRIAKDGVRFATQSGPMLVIDGALHPRLLPQSTSHKRRNGVGAAADGEIVFVLADTAVTFYAFASYFKDVLQTPNALYLDGVISRLYAPELGRNDQGAAMGPIVGAVQSASKEIASE